MHFVGSNLSTDRKCPKCIYKISKNFRVEKNGEISRNLRFSLVFVPASKSDTHHGWDGRIRTDGCGSQSPVPYRLATSQYEYPLIIPQFFSFVNSEMGFCLKNLKRFLRDFQSRPLPEEPRRHSSEKEPSVTASGYTPLLAQCGSSAVPGAFRSWCGDGTRTRPRCFRLPRAEWTAPRG